MLPTKQPQIILVGKNSLMMIGLKSLLKEIIPFVRIRIYSTNEEIMTSNNNKDAYHFFITSTAYIENPDFYNIYKTKTIILSDDERDNNIPKDFRRLNMLLGKDEILKDLLRIQQHAHHDFIKYPKYIAQKLSIEQNVLSQREIDVLCLLAKGHINKEIACKLNISINTVITHRKNIMQKLQSRSLSKLVIYAVTHGYIKIDEIS